jgi:hypothetical protein
MAFKISILCLLVLGFIFSGCKKDDNPADSGPTETYYGGIVAGGGISGSIIVTIPIVKRGYPATSAEGDTVEIAGALRIVGGATISLAGYVVISTVEFDSTADFYLAGGGYTFTGFVGEGNITGSFMGPGGSGIFVAEATTTGSVLLYCGTFQDDPPNTDSGTFNVVIKGTEVIVIIYPQSRQGGDVLAGTLVGTTITIYNPASPTTPIATGTLNSAGDMVSGTYDVGVATGSWSGSLCN